MQRRLREGAAMGVLLECFLEEVVLEPLVRLEEDSKGDGRARDGRSVNDS